MSLYDQSSKFDKRSEKMVEIINPDATSDVLLICEHASNHIPSKFNGLGLSEETINSHAAWDIGAFYVAKIMSKLLDATVIAPRFSRLLYDCNRPPSSPTAMPVKSEIYDISGNVNLSKVEKNRRVKEFYLPYSNALNNLLFERTEASRLPIIVTIHSFTPTYHGKRREVEVGVIHDKDSRLAEIFLKICKDDSNLICQVNAPYGQEDGVTHTLSEYAVAKGLHNIMVEIKNDLITEDKGQYEMAEFLASCLKLALKKI